VCVGDGTVARQPGFTRTAACRFWIRCSVTGTEVPDVRHISLTAGEFVVRTEVRNGVLKQAVVDLEPDGARRERVVRALLFSGGAGLLLAALGRAWMGRRAVRPLADALAL
jgi:two-component system OmpR family sensor kinase